MKISPVFHLSVISQSIDSLVHASLIRPMSRTYHVLSVTGLMFFAFKPPCAVLSSRASARKKKFQCSHFVSYNLADPYSDWEERVGVVGTE